MTAQQVIHEDRRLRRRRESIEEALDIAAGLMAEHGVAGLSIGELARRMGVRPPSLYVYFPSKHALYDALFARGARAVLAALEPALSSVPAGSTLEDLLHARAEAFVRWALENAAYTQLLFWRPVPGFQPSPQAYEPAVQLLEAGRALVVRLQESGLLRRDVPAAVILRDWTILTSGVVSQQLSNAPEQTFEGGTFTAALPELVSMFARHYAAPTPARRRGGIHRADTR